MLFANAKLYFTEQMARYKCRRIKKLLQKEAKRLQKLYKDNEAFEQTYQELKEKYNDQTSLVKTQKRASKFSAFLKKTNLAFIDGFSQSQNIKLSTKQYKQTRKQFKTLYKRKQEIKKEYHKSIRRVSKRTQNAEKWFCKYNPMSQAHRTILDSHDAAFEMQSYDRCRKGLNYVLKTNPHLKNEYNRKPFHEKIKWTFQLYSDPQQTKTRLVDENEMILREIESMSKKPNVVMFNRCKA